MKSILVRFTALTAILISSTVVWGHQIQYTTLLAGPNESPPNTSPATGSALVTVDLDLATMRVETSFSGLLGNVTAAHIHCCTAVPFEANVGVASPTPTFPGFPSGVTSGSYDMTFDLSDTASYNASFLTANGGTASGAMNALLAGLDEGKAYLNVHTSEYPGGEIRGFFVPEPASGSLLLCGLAALATVRRRR